VHISLFPNASSTDTQKRVDELAGSMANTSTTDVDLVGSEMTLNVARVALFAALMGAFAYVSFPNPLVPSVPVTLQVLGVFLAAIFLGPVWGGAAMVVYLLAGALGVPVFSSGSAGLGSFFGATGGYLVSYPFAAFLVGAVIHGGFEPEAPKSVSFGRLIVGMALAVPVVYAFGIPVYWYYLDVTWTTAIVNAGLLFLPAEAVKIAAAVGIVHSDRLNTA
jgi:biotin transport system substrate-specific component